MTNVDQIATRILQGLLTNFRSRGLDSSALRDGYEGPNLAAVRKEFGPENTVDFDLALNELESKELIDTGPMAAHDNEPDSGIFIVGVYSKREYVFLTERGYKEALKAGASPIPRAKRREPSTHEMQHFYGIHPAIQEKCGELYEAQAYAEAVEKSFKIVRDCLRALTGHETGSEAFGKGHLHIRGAAAPNVEEDFNKGVQFLTMAIDRFRNEKSHTSDAKIVDPIRAHQYLSLSSLALYLLEGAEVRS